MSIFDTIFRIDIAPTKKRITNYMEKKSQITSFLFLLIINIINAQGELAIEGIKTKLGAPQKHEALSIFIGEDKTGTYMLRTLKSKSMFLKNPRYWLEHFNDNLNPTKLERIDVNEKKKDYDLEKILLMNGMFYLFTSHYNKKTDVQSYYYQTIDKKSFLVNSEKKKIYELKIIGKIKKKPVFRFRFSPDEKSLIIYYTELGEVTSGNVYNLKVFDTKMNLVWETRDKNTNSFRRYTSWSSLLLDNDRNVYILALDVERRKKSEFTKKWVEEKIASKVAIFKFEDQGNRIDSFYFSFDDYKMGSGQLLLNDDLTLSCVGQLTKQKRSSLYGTFYCNIDMKNKTVSNVSYNKLEDKIFLEDANIKKRAVLKLKLDRGEDQFLKNHRISKVFKNKRNQTFLVSERRSISIDTGPSRTGQNSTEKTTIYNFHEMVLAKYSESGEHLWTVIVPKKLSFEKPYGGMMSYAYKEIEDDFYLFFSDTRKSFGYDSKIKMPKSTPNKFIAIVKIDDEGNYTKSSLTNEFGRIQLFGSGQIDRSDSRIILRAGLFNKQQLLGVEF